RQVRHGSPSDRTRVAGPRGPATKAYEVNLAGAEKRQNGAAVECPDRASGQLPWASLTSKRYQDEGGPPTVSIRAGALGGETNVRQTAPGGIRDDPAGSGSSTGAASRPRGAPSYRGRQRPAGYRRESTPGTSPGPRGPAVRSAASPGPRPTAAPSDPPPPPASCRPGRRPRR